MCLSVNWMIEILKKEIYVEGTREEVMHSYELLARYVMPQFQGSLTNLEISQEWSEQHRDELQALKTVSIDSAIDQYKNRS